MSPQPLLKTCKGESSSREDEKGSLKQDYGNFQEGRSKRVNRPENCLRRELQEEMKNEIEPYAFFAVNEHAYETVEIRLFAYRARLLKGEIELTDHDEYRWVQVGEMMEYSFAPADIPFIQQLCAQI